MISQRYPEEFKTEAVKQILEHGHRVVDVADRLGVSTHSLYKWVRKRQMPLAGRTQQLSQSDELRRLKDELKRVSEERDILKKRRRTSLGSPAEVRIHRSTPSAVQRATYVPCPAAAPQRVLRLEGTTGKFPRPGRPQVAGLAQARLAGKRWGLRLPQAHPGHA